MSADMSMNIGRTRGRRARPWDAWPANVRLAVAGTAGVMVSCWTVSFDAIVAGAQAASIPFVFALLCPVIVDGEMAIGTLALVSVSRYVKRRTRVYLGMLILASVGVSMAANMAGPYTRTHLLPAPWSYLAAGVPSMWIALIVHQLVILWRHVHRPSAEVSAGAVRPTVESRRPVIMSSPASRRRPDSLPDEGVAARVDALVTYLQQQADAGRDPFAVGVSELSRATGIPRPTVYRLRTDALSTLRPEPVLSGPEAA